MVAWAASILLIVLTTACCIHLLSYMFSAPTLEEVHRSSINPLMHKIFCLLTEACTAIHSLPHPSQ